MILEYALCNNVATSLWLFMAWAPWVFTVFGQRTSVVGELAAINGLFEILGAAGSGTIADKQWWGITRRHAVQLAMCIGLLSMVLHVVGIVVRSLSVLVVAQAVFGTFLGASMSSVEALMADCVEGGKRDGIYSLKYFLEMSGPLVGCGVSVLLFAVVGNTFTESILTSATLTGILVHCVSMLRLLVRLPSHDAAITSAAAAQQKEKETVDVASGGGDVGGGDRSRLARFADMSGCCSSTADLIMAEEDRRLTIDEDERWEECVVVVPPPLPSPQHDASSLTASSTTLVPPSLFVEVARGNETQHPNRPSGDPCSLPLEAGRARSSSPFSSASPPPVLSHSALPTVPRFPGCLSALLTIQRIPYICAAHDIILTAGSGLTTMYFSLFMIEEYNISPIVLAVLQGACGLATGALVALCGKLGPLYGRTQTVTVIKFIGAWLLCCLAVLPRGTPVVLVMLLYALRYGLMNCCSGLFRSLLMDLVPPSQRARWSAVESVVNASWSGTSIVGGFVVEAYGYRTGFLTTFVCHMVAVGVLAPATLTEDRLVRLPNNKTEGEVAVGDRSLHNE